MRRRGVLAALALGGAALAAGAPPIVHDDLGRRIALPAPARRVVALAPSAVETLFALGAGECVAATVAEADYPPAVRSIRRVGGWLDPHVESILALRPDLVVVVRGNPRDLADRLRGQGLAVFVSDPHRLRDAMRNLMALGILTGHEREARQRLEALRGRVLAVRRRVAGRAPVRAALLVWDDPIMIAGGDSFADDVLALAGAENVGRTYREAYPRVDPERFLQLDPDAILVPGADARRLRAVAARPGLRQTAAARSGRVYGLHPDWIQRPGPRLVDAIEEVARRLHGEAFGSPERSPAALRDR